MTSENTVELAIPATALARSIAPHGVLMTEAEEADQIRYVAAPVVAAELRRLSDSALIQDEFDVASLRRRADELDPPAVRQED